MDLQKCQLRAHLNMNKEMYPPPLNDSHPFRNHFIYIEICIPFVEPWVAGVNHFIGTIIAVTVCVVNIQVVRLGVCGDLVGMSRSGLCVLVEVIVTFHKLYSISVV